MRFRDGLIAARAQILWIASLVLTSALILRADLAPDETPAAHRAVTTPD